METLNTSNTANKELEVMTGETNVIKDSEIVKSAIIDLNRLGEIQAEIKSLKSESDNTLQHLFKTINEVMQETTFKGLEALTMKQKRYLVLSELEAGIDEDDKYSQNVLSVIKWYFTASKLSIKKEFITLKTLKALKGAEGYYSKNSVNNLMKLATNEEYRTSLDGIVTKAKNLKTVVKMLKKGEKIAKDTFKVVPIEGIKTFGNKVEYKLNEIDYKAVNIFLKEVYIAQLTA